MSDYKTALLSYIRQLKYAHWYTVATDVLRALEEYVDLDFEEDVYVYEDGVQKKLLKLKGTIPVKYEGSDYDVPIVIWLSKRHPNRPPIAYVAPSARMHVMSGNFVDMNGKVQIPYLSEWNYPNSDLLSLLQIMITVFSEELPVRGRFAAQTSSSGYNNTEQSSRDTLEDSGEVCDRMRADGENLHEQSSEEVLEHSDSVHGRSHHKDAR